MCQLVPNAEWSGVLFGTVSGKVDDLVYRVKYMHIMSVDGAASTSFKWAQDDELNMLMFERENELLMSIHSHHTMNAFFSGTDDNELATKAVNGPYVMLIVNNQDHNSWISALGIKQKQNIASSKKVETFRINPITNKIQRFISNKADDSEIEVIEKVPLTIEVPEINLIPKPERDFVDAAYNRIMENKPIGYKPQSIEFGTHSSNNFNNQIALRNRIAEESRKDTDIITEDEFNESFIDEPVENNWFNRRNKKFN